MSEDRIARLENAVRVLIERTESLERRLNAQARGVPTTEPGGFDALAFRDMSQEERRLYLTRQSDEKATRDEARIREENARAEARKVSGRVDELAASVGSMQGILMRAFMESGNPGQVEAARIQAAREGQR